MQALCKGSLSLLQRRRDMPLYSNKLDAGGTSAGISGPQCRPLAKEVCHCCAEHGACLYLNSRDTSTRISAPLGMPRNLLPQTHLQGSQRRPHAKEVCHSSTGDRACLYLNKLDAGDTSAGISGSQCRPCATEIPVNVSPTPI